MKTINSGLLILTIALFTFSLSIAQEEENKNKMYDIHIDNVNFDKMMDYEGAAKELKENFVKHNIQDVSWNAISTEDGRYIFVTEIESMSDLDTNRMAPLFEKMGDEAAGKIFDTMNECYDSHSNHISHYLDGLSYHPESAEYTDEDTHLEYHFLYYTPKNRSAIWKAMKAVKDLFVAKNITNGHSVYHSGYGSEESYYLVVIRAENGLEIAQNGIKNDKILGEEGDTAFFDLIKLTSRYDQVEARLRPDLSYYPKKD